MGKRQKLTSCLHSKRRQRTGNATSTMASRPQAPNRTVAATTMPHEWQRCSEGFQLKDCGDDGKVLAPSHHGSSLGKRPNQNSSTVIRKRRNRDSLSGVVGENQIRALSNLQQSFGQKWIQSEMQLPHPVHNQPHTSADSGPRLQASSSTVTHRMEQCQSAHDPDEVLICWNDSDNESDVETNPKQQKLHPAPPVKTSLIKNSTQKCQRRKTAKHHAAKDKKHKLSDSDESDSAEIIFAPESDEETDLNNTQQEACLHSESASPTLQIECLGSPEQASPFSVDEDDEGNSLHHRESHHNSHSYRTENPGRQGGTPSISSCTSSQTGPDSDLSPAQGGLRASEWARQVKWETTPSKQRPASPPDPGDSAKKKKKFVKGGIAEQMSRILQREKSARRMWQHQHKSHDTPHGANVLTVKVRSLESVYHLQLADCSIERNPGSHKPSVNPQCFVLFHPHSSLCAGVSVHIFPPWQQMDTAKGDKVLLCTRYLVGGQATTSSSVQTGEVSATDNATLSFSPQPGAHGRWMCPCFTDGKLAPSKCPAHLFPFLPASLAQGSVTVTMEQEKMTSLGKILHTVTGLEGRSKRTLTFDTLLESIEKARAGDKLLPTFQAVVLRVFHEQREGGSTRPLLLLEDSQGTVAVISGAEIVGDVESHLCAFSCLRVLSRTNMDRDPALFSAVAGAWSDRVKTGTGSQDSDRVMTSDDSNRTSQRVAQPPGFCYLLEVDRCACDVLCGEEWLRVLTTTHTPDLSRPLVCTTLAQALQCQQQSKRMSAVVKVIYESVPGTAVSSQDSGDGNTHRKTSELFVCDHSLQKPGVEKDSLPSSHQCQNNESEQNLPDSGSLPGYIKVQVRSDCISDNIRCETGGSKVRPYLLLLKDVWIVSGTWICDKYSSLKSLEGNNEEARALESSIDSSLRSQVMECVVSLPPVSALTPSNSLVCVSGVIEAVDEKSAFCWEECDGCGSDQLATKSTTGMLVCLGCRKVVSSPVVRMKMEVMVRSSEDPSLIISISLLQPTIEKLLPDSKDEEGYDMDCVLQKPVGPISCVVTSSSAQSHGAACVQLTAVQLPL